MQAVIMERDKSEWFKQ